MPIYVWILIAIGLLGLYVAYMYNGLVRLRNLVDEAWNQITVQLKRRHDLIPNLVEAVKGYMQFEQETLTRVVEARNAAVAAQAGGPTRAAQSAQAEGLLTGMLRQLFALVEKYPELKANQNVTKLQSELATTENQIASTRQTYNTDVRQYNTAIQQFPAVLMAGMMGFGAREYFETDQADTAVPQVDITSGR